MDSLENLLDTLTYVKDLYNAHTFNAGKDQPELQKAMKAQAEAKRAAVGIIQRAFERLLESYVVPKTQRSCCNLSQPAKAAMLRLDAALARVVEAHESRGSVGATAVPEKEVRELMLDFATAAHLVSPGHSCLKWLKEKGFSVPDNAINAIDSDTDPSACLVSDVANEVSNSDLKKLQMMEELAALYNATASRAASANTGH